MTTQRGDPSAPSQATIKRLFAKSGNRCAFRGCSFELIHGKTVIAEVCHVKAASPNGPRYDPSQSPAERHAFENLVLMCANHHTVIDDDPDAYTVESLLKMKNDHEARATTLNAEEVDRGTKQLFDESVTSISQSGGITAHTVNVAIHAAQSVPSSSPDRQSIVASARHFHNERVSKVGGASPTVAVLDGGIFVVHLSPFSAVNQQPSPSFDEISRNPRQFPPIATDFPRDSRVAFEGLTTGSNAEGLTKPQRAYVQVLRSGVVEAVASSLARGREHNFLMLPQIQAMLIKSTFLYARALSAVDVSGPLVVSASLIGVRDMRLVHDFLNNAFVPEDLPYGALDQPRYDFTESILETTPADYVDCAKQLKSTLTHMANAAGMATSPYFDPNGNYTLKP